MKKSKDSCITVETLVKYLTDINEVDQCHLGHIKNLSKLKVRFHTEDASNLHVLSLYSFKKGYLEIDIGH